MNFTKSMSVLTLVETILEQEDEGHIERAIRETGIDFTQLTDEDLEVIADNPEIINEVDWSGLAHKAIEHGGNLAQHAVSAVQAHPAVALGSAGVAAAGLGAAALLRARKRAKEAKEASYNKGYVAAVQRHP